MEKRKHARHSVKVDAVITFQASESYLCKIEDYSQSGLLVKLSSYRSSQQGPLENKVHSQGQVSFKSDGRYHPAKVEVVHGADASLGLRFTADPEAFINAIQRHSSSSSQQPTAVATQTEAASRLLGRDRFNFIEKANQAFQQYFDERSASFFAEVRQTLMEQADRQKTDADQHPYFAAISGFEKQAKRIDLKLRETIFAQAMALVDPSKKPSAGDAVRDSLDPLALVEKDEFEDWLVVRVTASKLEDSFRETLSALQTRFDAAFAENDKKFSDNPYTPLALCQGLALSIGFLTLPTKIERTVFSVYRTVILDHLQLFYDDLNAIFINAGVLPDLNVTKHLIAKARAMRQQGEVVDTGPVVTNVEPTPEAESTPAIELKANLPELEPAPSSATPSPISPKATQAGDTYSALRNLQQIQRQPISDSAGFNSAARTNTDVSPLNIPTSLGAALEQIKHQTQGHTEAFQSSAPLTGLMNNAAQAGVALSSETMESVGFVDNLMEQVVQRSNVDPAMVPILKRLEIPMLEKMEADDLFAKGDHPFQQLINKMVMLSSKDSLNIAANKKLLEDSVEEILTDGDLDASQVEQKINELDSHLSQQNTSAERNRSRVLQTYEGKEKLTRANQDVEEELAHRLEHKKVPMGLLSLVDQGWRELMRLCHLREGKNSRAWEIALMVLDQLVLRVEKAGPDPDKVTVKPEELMKLVERGLNKVPSAQSKIAEICLDIRSWVVDADFNNVQWGFFQTETSSLELEGKNQQHLGRWLKRATNMPVNQWVEFIEEDGESKNCQLIWKSLDKKTFVFVDRLGRKANELDAAELAHQLKVGQCAVLLDQELDPLDTGMRGMLESAHEEILEQHSKDLLTDVYERNAFERLLANAIAENKRKDLTHSLCLFDVRGLRAINSALGFAGGDELLKAFANRLKNNTEEDTQVGRLGGNLFAILFPTSDEGNAYRQASSLKETLELNKYQVESEFVEVAVVSVLLTFDQTQGSVAELLHQSDTALQIARQLDKKEVQVVDVNDPEYKKYDQNIATVAVVNRALDGDNLSLRAQRIAAVDAKASQQPIYEILISVIDDSGEVIAADQFIRAAEDHHLVGKVDRKVISEVFKWMVENREFVNTIDGLSINLSGQSINDETLIDFLFNEFVASQVPRQKIIFEITELTALANFDDAADIINELKNIGCRFSIDNFGMAQSAYSSLRSLPVDIVKIEGDLIANMVEDKVDFGLIRSIVELGHFLDKKVVAKHITDAKLKRAVEEVGVDYVQGYFVGKPLLLEQLPLAGLQQSM